MPHSDQNKRRQILRALTLVAVLIATVGIVQFFRSNGSNDAPPHPEGTHASRNDGPSHHPTAEVPLGLASNSRPASLVTEDVQRLENRWSETDNPSRDGWETEAFSAEATKQLKQLGKFIEHPQDLTRDDFVGIVTSDFRCTRLQPDNLELVFSDDIFQVRRANLSKGVQKPAQDFKGPQGLQEALLQLVEPFAEAKNIRTKFKIFRVQVANDETTTRQSVEITGQLVDGVIEQHATWDVRWLQESNSAPRMTSLEVIEFDQIRARTPAGTLFSDCTRSVLDNNSCYAEQFLQGYGLWMLRKPYSRYQITEMMGHPGLAIGDVNGDGLADLYVCQEQGLPNRLFLQKADGTVDDVSAAWGVDWLQACRSALFVDLDNDGDQDLVVSFLGGVVVASNEARSGFRVQSILPTGDDMISLAAADFDNDGDLDIYATAYYADKILSERQVAGVPASGDEFVYHDANVGGRNTLLRNETQSGAWKFVDVTEQVGLAVNNTRYTFASAWEDFDRDGDQDLYVANDYGRDNLYRNDGGRFVDVSDEVGAENAASGMSVTWSDFDRDGWMDVYVSNMWSAAGNRVTYQPFFKRDAPPEVKQRLQRFARGNTLLQNDGKQRFLDVSAEAGVEMGRWAWGSLFADINNDGWDDLLIANGFITKDIKGGDL